MDPWIVDDSNTFTPALVERLQTLIEEESAIIIEHRFYRGSREPSRWVCNNARELVEYLRGARPGDAIWVWSFEDCCPSEAACARGKWPDAEGRIPVGGAY